MMEQCHLILLAQDGGRLRLHKRIYVMPVSAANVGAGVGGGLGALLASKFGSYTNPAKKAGSYLDEIPGIEQFYMSPFYGTGKESMLSANQQFKKLLADPGGFLNEMGKGYQKSPGFDFAMKEALSGAGHAAAAGGMAGSPQHEEQNMGIATELGNKDYNDWLSKALGLYGTGLQGETGMGQMGFDAAKELADSINASRMQKAQLEYVGQNAQNQRNGGMWGAAGNALGQIGSLLAFA